MLRCPLEWASKSDFTPRHDATGVHAQCLILGNIYFWQPYLRQPNCELPKVQDLTTATTTTTPQINDLIG